MPSLHLRKRLNKFRIIFKSDLAAANPTDSDNLPNHHDGENNTTAPVQPVVASASSIDPFRSTKDTAIVSKDPLGLQIVHIPDTGPIKADIVFIHGLGGTSRMTWSKDRDIRFFWPGEFLPKEPDICQARISTFGCNADFRSSTRTSLSILDFARELLYDLKYAQSDKTKGTPRGQVSNVSCHEHWHLFENLGYLPRSWYFS